MLFFNDFNVHLGFLRLQIICNEPCKEVAGEIINGAVPWVLYLTYVLQFIIDGFDDGPLAQHNLVVEVHERVLHVLPDFSDEMDVINEEPLEEFLRDISPVGKQLSKDFFR